MWLLLTSFMLESSTRVCTYRHIQVQNLPPLGWQMFTVLLFGIHKLLGAWQSIAALPGFSAVLSSEMQKLPGTKALPSGLCCQGYF